MRQKDLSNNEKKVMIPKIIHYCWFGKGQMPRLAKKCIESWKRFLPDYELKEWNEYNFNIEEWDFAKEAYENRKYAFVADVVRMYALYHYGGIYLDTDVEVLKPFDNFLHCTAFCGFEDDNYVATCVIGSEKGGTWAKDQLDYYRHEHFIKKDNTLDTTTNVKLITEYMLRHGLLQNNTRQEFKGLITIYPRDFFCPKSYIDIEEHFSNNTAAVHHFAGSWLSRKARRRIKRNKRRCRKEQRKIARKIFFNKIKSFFLKL